MVVKSDEIINEHDNISESDTCDQEINLGDDAMQKNITDNQTDSIDANVQSSNLTSNQGWWFNRRYSLSMGSRIEEPPSASTTLPDNPLVDGIISNVLIRHDDSKPQNSTAPSVVETNLPEGSNTGEQLPNIIVPNFDSLPSKTIFSSIWELASSILNRATIFRTPAENAERIKPLYKTSAMRKIEHMKELGGGKIRSLIIGVHGFFPTKMIRRFIGEPTGTSNKFIQEAEVMVRKYFDDSSNIEIDKIALEREGHIFDRVRYFYEVLEAYKKELNDYQFIYFVAHSQGCPVTIILLAKLIARGILNINTIDSGIPSDKVVTVLAMAGINNGPFFGADQTLFGRAIQAIERSSAREMFEFQKFDSAQSRSLMDGVRTLVNHNIKITFVGAINDQLVPLYSSLCLFAHHPNLLRAVFVDKTSNTPKFITRIVKIATELLNLGYDEHGIIKEISASLAGPLTSGGHSAIYKEQQVYTLGIKFALETTDIETTKEVKYTPYQLAELGSNPYHLPWCMRGVMYETQKHLDPQEITDLKLEFDEWEPQTKVLKDIKHRLIGLQGRI